MALSKKQICLKLEKAEQTFDRWYDRCLRAVSRMKKARSQVRYYQRLLKEVKRPRRKPGRDDQDAAGYLDLDGGQRL